MAEQIVAADRKAQRIAGIDGKLPELLGALRLIKRRMRRAIGKYQPVHTELTIVGFIAKIAAVGLPGFALIVIAGQALINPVPDEAALQTRELAEGLPVLSKTAKAVAHGIAYSHRISGRVSPGRPIHFFSDHFGTAGKG